MTGKKCVITGGAGFIGSYLAEKLLSTGFNVHIVDNLSTGKLTNIAHLKDNPNLTFHRFDVRHKNKMLEVADGADWVFHLAAMVGVKQVLDQPFETIQNNVNATENVINATLKTGSALFLASSSEVYGDNPNPVCSEANGLQVGSPYSLRWAYSAGKVFDEFLAASARRHDQRIIIGRFFNIIGRKQNARYGMVVPRFLQQAMKHQPLTVYGDGYQSRCLFVVIDSV
jgi:UDP-glucose 4-epimerase